MEGTDTERRFSSSADNKTQRLAIIGRGLGTMLSADALTVQVAGRVPEQVLEYRDFGKMTVIPQALRKLGSDD
jgi:hypothetical protein